MEPLFFEKMERILVLAPNGGFEQDKTFQGAGKRFKKEVLYEGTFIHPNTGNKHEFDRGTLEGIARQSNTLTAAGVKIPFPDGHVWAAKENMGNWAEFHTAPSKSKGAKPGATGLWAWVNVPIEADAVKIGKTIDSVSVMLSKEVKLVDGTIVDGPVCTHVCATDYPVIPGQSNFEAAFSKVQGADTGLLFLSGDQTMELKKILMAALGLKGDQTDEQIAAALRLAIETRDQKVTELTRKNESLLEDVNVALGRSNSVQKTDREIKLERELFLSRGEKVNAQIEAAIKEGRTTKAEADVFTKLMAIGEVTAILFGKETPETVNVSKELLALLASRAKDSMVNLSTASTRGTTNELEAQKKFRSEQAAYFEKKGHTIVWNSDRTDFTVQKGTK